MALERAGSRLAAMRNPYCLLVETGSPAELPGLLRPYYQAPWSVELRVLYKDGEESRRQWLFRDGQRSRLAAVFTGNAEEEAGEEEAGEEESPGDSPSPGGEEESSGGERQALGFIEVFGDHGFIILERQFLEDGEMIIDYVYRAQENPGLSPENRQTLVRADARSRPSGGEEQALYTDYYRYTRNHSLRLIERVFSRPPGEAAEAPAVLRFPRRSLDSESEMNFAAPVPVYGSRFLEDIQADPSQRIVYTTDERGRVLTETSTDEDGTVLGEIRNSWSGDRLSKVTWSGGGEERVTEYSYNQEGDRIEERNYRNGVLERLVRIQGDREEEDLYMNGEPILRTLWEGGRKIREEELRPGRPRGGAPR
jgi:hypothetical protein